MMQRCRALLLTTVPFLLSSPAWALFDAQVLTGKRSTAFKYTGVTHTESGSELKAAFHLDPIPLVPIGFGISAGQSTWDTSTALGFKSMDGYEIGLELEAWLPMELAGFEPYAKLGYTVGGAYVASYTDGYKLAYKPSGTYLAAGLKYKFLLRLGVMLEVEQGTRTLAFDAVKDLPAGIDTTGQTGNITATNTSFLVGIQAGL